MILNKNIVFKNKIFIICVLGSLSLPIIFQNNKYLIRLQQCIVYHLSTNKVAMPLAGWDYSNIITKNIKVKNDGLYNIYVLLEYDEKYPYHNMYLQCSCISDTENNNISTSKTDTLFNEITEYQLFDEKTGYPIGTGLWNRKIICMILKNNVQLHKGVSYTISLQHMMRNESLPGIKSIKIYF